jgi:hypothetical protein
VIKTPRRSSKHSKRKQERKRKCKQRWLQLSTPVSTSSAALQTWPARNEY